jgi:acetyl esterase/lipase
LKQIEVMKRICFIGLVFLLFSCNRINTHYQSVVDQHKNPFWGHHYAQACDINYGKHPDQRMDIYSQGSWIGEPNYWKPDSIMHKTLIYIHGGGWLGGTKNQITPFIIPYLERGWNVVCLEYRTGKGTAPQAVDDCMQALKWLADNANFYNIDIQNVVLSGESAGGHLALISGMLNSIPDSHPYLTGDRIRIKAILNWFGITDIAEIDQFFRKNNEEWNYARLWVGNDSRMDSISNAFSPVHRIGPDCPPILSIHGKMDTAVPYDQAVTLHEKLVKAGIRNQFISFDDARHLGFTEAEFQEIYSQIFTFLAELNL